MVRRAVSAVCHARPRRLGPLLVCLLIAVALAPATTSGAEMSFAQAETELVRLINRDRAAAGLVPLVVDSRLTAIARARSDDMAARTYFSHTQPDGRSVFDLIPAAGITWYEAGENLAWNTYPGLADSAAAADQGWLASPSHRAILLSDRYNYVGIGLAVDGAGKRLWTAVFLRGPDRTGGWAKANAPVRTTATSSGSVGVKLSWRGADVRLQVLTAGLRDFQVQRRVDGGSWTVVRSSTTATTLSGTYRTGHRYEFRVRARDKAGNAGSWTPPVSITI